MKSPATKALEASDSFEEAEELSKALKEAEEADLRGYGKCKGGDEE